MARRFAPLNATTAVFMLLAWLAATDVVGALPSDGPSLDLDAIQRAVLSLYPYLRGQNVFVTAAVRSQPFNGPLTTRRLVVSVDHFFGYRPPPPPETPHLLYLNIDCDNNGGIVEVRAGLSEHVPSGRLDKLRALVWQHPTWSDERVASALDEAGAQFGPAHRTQVHDRVVQIVSAMTGFQGSVRIGTLNRPKRPASRRDGEALLWKVVAEQPGPAARDRFTLWLEPIDGKVVHFVRSR